MKTFKKYLMRGDIEKWTVWSDAERYIIIPDVGINSVATSVGRVRHISFESISVDRMRNFYIREFLDEIERDLNISLNNAHEVFQSRSYDLLILKFLVWCREDRRPLIIIVDNCDNPSIKNLLGSETILGYEGYDISEFLLIKQKKYIWEVEV